MTSPLTLDQAFATLIMFSQLERAEHAEEKLCFSQPLAVSVETAQKIYRTTASLAHKAGFTPWSRDLDNLPEFAEKIDQTFRDHLKDSLEIIEAKEHLQRAIVGLSVWKIYQYTGQTEKQEMINQAVVHLKNAIKFCDDKALKVCSPLPSLLSSFLCDLKKIAEKEQSQEIRDQIEKYQPQLEVYFTNVVNQMDENRAKIQEMEMELAKAQGYTIELPPIFSGKTNP